MKTIGFLGKDIDESYVFNKKYLRVFSNTNCIGLFPDSDYSICDGFIIQGGKNIEDWFYDVVEYAIENNKPVLGICLGCQVLGTYKNGFLKKVDNHMNISHVIHIDKTNFLYDLYGDNILVNSKHEEAIDELSDCFDVIATSEDGIIEAIRCKDLNNFIVGVQWHPEELDYMDDIFDKFMSEL